MSIRDRILAALKPTDGIIVFDAGWIADAILAAIPEIAALDSAEHAVIDPLGHLWWGQEFFDRAREQKPPETHAVRIIFVDKETA